MDFKVIAPPTYSGYYRVGNEHDQGINFCLEKKPKALHRFFVKLILGWTWIDND